MACSQFVMHALCYKCITLYSQSGNNPDDMSMTLSGLFSQILESYFEAAEEIIELLTVKQFTETYEKYDSFHTYESYLSYV